MTSLSGLSVKTVLGDFLLELGEVLRTDEASAQEMFGSPLGLNDPRSWLEMADYATQLGQFHDLLERPYFENRAALLRLKADAEDGPGSSRWTRSSISAYAGCAESAARSEAYAGAMQIALAARRFRAITGYCPASVDEMSSVLPNPPIDPFTGMPFRYRIEGEGILVYSIGADGVDQGGASGSDIAVRLSR